MDNATMTLLDSYLNRIATALERIADSIEGTNVIVETIQGPSEESDPANRS